MLLTAAIAAHVLVTAGSVARAGGSVLDVHEKYLHWDQVVVTTTTFDEIPGYGSIEDGPWYAYLGPPRLPDDVEDGIRLGRLTFRRMPGPHARVRLDFRVPRVPVGDYFIRLCNPGCTDGLSDIVGAAITISRTEDAASLMQRVDRSHANLTNRLHRTGANMREHVNAAISRERDKTQAVLERILRSQRAFARRPAGEAVPGWVLLGIPGAFLLGAITAWTARGRSREDARSKHSGHGREAPAA